MDTAILAAVTATPEIGAGTELGGGRYRLLAPLGKGGFGEVYRARDQRLELEVAVKVLLNVEPSGLLRFKREFRALADVTHPNLVDLYEMHHQTRSATDPWFFSMELIDGANILEALASDNLVVPLSASRPVSGRNPAADRDETRALPTGQDTTAGTPHTRAPRPWRAPDYERLQPALRQLVEGLAHLHTCGKLHCDVKPSNVLVEAGGRVVVLDFGLVAEVGRAGDDFVIGTPAYMSPEQAAGRPLTPASDWYAVGVVLYELLTGQRPFDAQGDEVLTLKQHVEPPSPQDRVAATYATDLAAQWPSGLATLCSGLLARRPGDRPLAADILAMLGAASRSSVVVSEIRPAFVGRELELAALTTAAKRSCKASSVVVVSGASGVGKTSLMEAFFAGTSSDAVVLRGRCYETESVPYPGLDEVVDTLAQWLRTLDDAQRRSLLPDGLDALVRVFPVLGSLREDASNTGPAPDPNQLAQQASAAFRDLLGRICATRPVVLFVDDVQWADLDTHKLLTELVADPTGRALIVLGCREPGQARFIDGAPQLTRLHLEPLDEPTATALVTAQIDDPAEVEVLVREAGGNPFLLTELVRHRVASGTRQADLTLRAMMEARLSELTEPARALLRTLAVAGYPLAPAVAGRASLVDDQDIVGAVKLLRARNLVRTSSSAEQRLEPYHDRARETLASLVDAETHAKIHGRLADTLFRTGSDDREAMALHCHRAGRTPEAAVHLSAAATRAMDKLAFERAADLLDLAMKLGGGSHPLRVRRAEALAAAGRGAEAAAAYDLAARDVDGARRLTLQWAAVNQLFVSGRITESFERGESLMRALGIKVIDNHATAALGVLYHRARLRLRGATFPERLESSLSPMERLRLDAGYSVAMGVAMVDPIIGAAYQGKNLADALRFGDPGRVARALVYEASYTAAISEDGWGRAQGLLALVEGIVDRSGDPQTQGYLLLGHGNCHYLAGDFAAAIPRLRATVEHLRKHCPEKRWEQVYAQSLALDALRWQGRWSEIVAELPALLDDSRRRGDVFAEALWQVKRIWATLLDDDPESGRRGLEEGMSRWHYRGSPFQRYWLAVGRGELELYSGRVEAARAEIEQPWASFRNALLLQIPLLAAEAWSFRGRAALAVAGLRGPDRSLLRLVRRAAGRLEAITMRTPWLAARAAMLRAGEAMAREDRSAAIGHLRSGAEVAQRTEQSLAKAVIDVRLAQLGVGDLDTALSVLDDAGFKAPVRFVSSELPGTWPSEQRP